MSLLTFLITHLHVNDTAGWKHASSSFLLTKKMRTGTIITQTPLCIAACAHPKSEKTSLSRPRLVLHQTRWSNYYWLFIYLFSNRSCEKNISFCWLAKAIKFWRGCLMWLWEIAVPPPFSINSKHLFVCFNHESSRATAARPSCLWALTLDI